MSPMCPVVRCYEPGISRAACAAAEKSATTQLPSFLGTQLGSISRVVLGVLVEQARGFDGRIDLGGADAGVAEHLLDGAQVSAAAEQVGGERVPQQVWLHGLLNAGALRAFLHDDPKRLS